LKVDLRRGHREDEPEAPVAPSATPVANPSATAVASPSAGTFDGSPTAIPTANASTGGNAALGQRDDRHGGDGEAKGGERRGENGAAGDDERRGRGRDNAPSLVPPVG